MITRRAFLTSAGVGGATLRTMNRLRADAWAAPATPTLNDSQSDGYVVDVAWLQRQPTSAAIKLVALQDAASFATAHLPGAAQIDWPDLELDDTSDASVDKWRSAVAARFAALGVTASDTVVAYDPGTLYSARIWWVLDQIGHPRKVILSGGLNGWTAGGGKVVTGPSTAEPAAAALPVTPNADGISTIAETIAAFSANAATFIDARSAAEYAKGHIPGALNIPFPTNAGEPPESRWKSTLELRAMYEAAGLTPDTSITPYCNSGVRSSTTYVALRRAGFERVSLFTGSWIEWRAHPELPITTGDAP